MSVGAICFTSSGSNGGCWVVLVFPRLFFGKMGLFFPYATYAKKKSLSDLHQKKKISVEKKNATYAKKKSLRDLRQKKKLRDLRPKKKRDLRLFPPSSYAFLGPWRHWYTLQRAPVSLQMSSARVAPASASVQIAAFAPAEYARVWWVVRWGHRLVVVMGAGPPEASSMRRAPVCCMPSR